MTRIHDYPAHGDKRSWDHLGHLSQNVVGSVVLQEAASVGEATEFIAVLFCQLA
jgi:hypothetical protein